MTAPDHSKPLYALIAKLKGKSARPVRASAPPPASQIEAKPAGDPLGCPIERCFHGDAVLREFVRSFLVWEAAQSKAEAALSRIAASVVDINELRVCLPDEIMHLLGSGYPRLEERVVRLRAALGDVYKREHCLRLAHLRDRTKREARAYLDGLTGTPLFVSARTALVALEAHAFPLDDRLAARLQDAGVLDEELPLHDAAAWLERTLKAGEALDAFLLIQSWADTPAKRPAARRAAGPRTSAKKGSPAARSPRPRKKG